MFLSDWERLKSLTPRRHGTPALLMAKALRKEDREQGAPGPAGSLALAGRLFAPGELPWFAQGPSQFTLP